MNKKELVKEIADKTGFTQKDTETILDSTIKTIEEALKNGNEVKFVGFGTFKKVKRKARTGRNPRDPKKAIKIPACNAVAFKAGKDLKDKVNSK